MTEYGPAWVRQRAAIALVALIALAQSALDAGSEPGQQADAAARVALVEAAVETHVLPRVRALADAAARLPAGVATVCKTGQASDREELDTYFRETVVAWAGVAYLRFGPLTENNRAERLSSLPDPRGVMQRQLRSLLARGDGRSIDNETITKLPSAVQGLPALEALLMDRAAPLGPANASAFRCALSMAIAGNISAIAREIDQGWTRDGGWKDKMLSAGPGNASYSSAEAAARDLIKALSVGLKAVAENEVKPHLYAKSKGQAPFDASYASVEYYSAGVMSLNALYEAMALERFLPGDKDWVKNSAGTAWRIILSSDGAGGRGVGVERGDEPPVQKVFEALGTMRKLIINEMAAAAGVSISIRGENRTGR